MQPIGRPINPRVAETGKVSLIIVVDEKTKHELMIHGIICQLLWMYHESAHVCGLPHVWPEHPGLLLSLNADVSYLASVPQKMLLFAYANGHFLINEGYQLNRRYVRSDGDELCTIIAQVGGRSSQVTAIDQMGGGSIKAFVMRNENGSEVIAKTPCQIAGLPTLTTAGEVGALVCSKLYWYKF